MDQSVRGVGRGAKGAAAPPEPKKKRIVRRKRKRERKKKEKRGIKTKRKLNQSFQEHVFMGHYSNLKAPSGLRPLTVISGGSRIFETGGRGNGKVTLGF